jgi:hypothetical protein
MYRYFMALCLLIATTISASAADLAAAVQQGDLAQVRAALSEVASAETAIPPVQLPPLTIATIRSDQAMVQLLWAAGADPNARDPAGAGPLLAAVRSCRSGPAVISARIAASADVNAANVHGDGAPELSHPHAQRRRSDGVFFCKKALIPRSWNSCSPRISTTFPALAGHVPMTVLTVADDMDLLARPGNNCTARFNSCVFDV